MSGLIAGHVIIVLFLKNKNETAQDRADDQAAERAIEND